MYDYTRKADLIRIKEAVDTASPSAKARVIAFCNVAGLMTPRGFYMKLLMSIVNLFKSPRERMDFLVRIYTHPKALPSIDLNWGQIAKWLVDGKDTSDARSAGGWNEKELDTFVQFCNNINILSITPDITAL